MLKNQWGMSKNSLVFQKYIVFFFNHSLNAAFEGTLMLSHVPRPCTEPLSALLVT